jgi:hypothetical protein
MKGGVNGHVVAIKTCLVCRPLDLAAVDWLITCPETFAHRGSSRGSHRGDESVCVGDEGSLAGARSATLASFPSSPAGAAASAPSGRYRGRHLIESVFCRLKDFRRVHTRYNKLAANVLSGVALATAMAFWRHTSLGP